MAMTSSGEPGSNSLSEKCQVLSCQNLFNILISQYWCLFRWSHWPPFFFLQVGPFQRQGTFVQEEYTLFRKPEVVIHGSCLCDLLSHVFALLSVIHAELCDHAESEYASWHSTSNCMGEVFLRTWLRWACFLFCVVLCLMHKWLSPALWFFAYNLISCAVLWLVNIRQEMQTGACGKYSFYMQFVLPKWQGMGYRYIQGQQGDTTLLERSSDNF